MGTLKGSPNPPALWLRRAKLASANAVPRGNRRSQEARRAPLAGPFSVFTAGDRRLMIPAAMSEPPISNRKSPRIEVYAQAEIRGEAIHIMAVRNVSAGGVYLEGTPQEYPGLKPGLEFDLMIFGSEEGM